MERETVLKTLTDSQQHASSRNALRLQFKEDSTTPAIQRRLIACYFFGWYLHVFTSCWGWIQQQSAHGTAMPARTLQWRGCRSRGVYCSFFDIQVFRCEFLLFPPVWQSFSCRTNNKKWRIQHNLRELTSASPLSPSPNHWPPARWTPWTGILASARTTDKQGVAPCFVRSLAELAIQRIWVGRGGVLCCQTVHIEFFLLPSVYALVLSALCLFGITNPRNDFCDKKKNFYNCLKCMQEMYSV